MNYAANAKNADGFWEGLGYFGVGALTGATSGFSAAFITGAGNSWITTVHEKPLTI